MKKFMITSCIIFIMTIQANAQEKSNGEANSAIERSPSGVVDDINESLCNTAKDINETVNDNKPAKWVHDRIGKPAQKAEEGFCKDKPKEASPQ